ncbi:MAG: hypothetical protein WC342_05730 [Methanoregula sp.]
MPSINSQDKKKSTLPHDGSNTSQDKKRNADEKQHHPETHLQPHAVHVSPQEQHTDSPRHYPHTQPTEHALDTDHGTHEDRPRPAKLSQTNRQQ